VSPFLRHAVPNGFSLARLFLGAAFPFLPHDWRLGVILLAGATDFLDGLSARWLKAESEFGRMFDPVADKVFVLALVGTLLAEGVLTGPWVLGIAARDGAVLVGVGWVVLRGRWQEARSLRPSWLGKCTTAAQFAVLAVAVAWGTPPVGFLAFTTILSVAAALDYARRFTWRPSPSA
jgi:phosphatidylglycerophosphate synthase